MTPLTLSHVTEAGREEIVAREPAKRKHTQRPRSPTAAFSAPVDGVVTIALPNGQCAFIDAADVALVRDYAWYATTRKNGRVYVRASICRNGKIVGRVYLHRMVMGFTDRTQMVDHVDRDGLNNRRTNLRTSSHGQNIANSMCRSRTGFKGVTKEFNIFHARIHVDGQHIRVGKFRSVEDAAVAYDAAARAYFGEFARLNFPLPGEQPARTVKYLGPEPEQTP